MAIDATATNRAGPLNLARSGVLERFRGLTLLRRVVLAAALCSLATLMLGLPFAEEQRSATGDAATSLDPALDRQLAGDSQPVEPSLKDTQQPVNEHADFIVDMQQRFGAILDRKHAQIRSLEQLMSYLQQYYPDDWETRVFGLLQQLFPEHAEALYQRFLALQGYSEWLERNRADLRRLPADQRRAQLWEQRYAAFGADANEIWAAERRSQALGQVLRELPADAPVLDKAQQFRAAIGSIYADQAEGLLSNRRTELINGFLTTPSVQQQLHALPAAERNATLRNVRSELGMDTEALARWDALDSHRDALWSTGQEYEAERRKLLATTSPAEAEWRLAELRRNSFGAQAEQISAEERSGFFRFAQARRYGRE